MDLSAKSSGLDARPCKTVELRLHGWSELVRDDSLQAYGSDAEAVASLLKERPGWAGLLHPRLPYRVGEIVWSVRYEAARTVEDVLARRLRALFLDARAAIEAAPLVATLLAEELGRDEVWRNDQIKEFEAVAAGYLLPLRR